MSAPTSVALRAVCPNCGAHDFAYNTLVPRTMGCTLSVRADGAVAVDDYDEQDDTVYWDCEDPAPSPLECRACDWRGDVDAVKTEPVTSCRRCGEPFDDDGVEPAADDATVCEDCEEDDD